MLLTGQDCCKCLQNVSSYVCQLFTFHNLHIDLEMLTKYRVVKLWLFMLNLNLGNYYLKKYHDKSLNQSKSLQRWKLFII